MKKALRLALRKLTTGSLCDADIYVADGRVVKFLRTNNDLEGTILHLGHALLGFAA
jgi:hypothetical protein